jgi:hypothetical protein
MRRISLVLAAAALTVGVLLTTVGPAAFAQEGAFPSQVSVEPNPNANCVGEEAVGGNNTGLPNPTSPGRGGREIAEIAQEELERDSNLGEEATEPGC